MRTEQYDGLTANINAARTHYRISGALEPRTARGTGDGMEGVWNQSLESISGIKIMEMKMITHLRGGGGNWTRHSLDSSLMFVCR
jgi:hypothetical protein